MRTPITPGRRPRRGCPSPLADDGIVALEFALIAPFFLLLVLGTMIFALYFATFVAVIHGANEGARASVGGLSNAERGQLATARVRDLFGAYVPLLDPARATITTSVPTGAQTYRVTVSYPVSDFGFGFFYSLQNSTFGNGSNATAPTSIGYSVVIANGGY